MIYFAEPNSLLDTLVLVVLMPVVRYSQIVILFE